MGVIGYRSLLISKYKKCLTKILNNYDYVFIDGNCILHETFVNGIDFYSQFPVVYEKFIKIFNEFKSENYYIVFDGQAPINKQLTQRLRRENNFEESSLLLPGIYIINDLEEYLIERFDPKINLISSNQIGEGEQKIFSILKEIKPETKLNIMIISLDTDIIILSQLFLLNKELFNVDVFIKKENDLIINFNVNELNKKMFKGKLNEDNLILFAFLSGNDFIIKNTTMNCDKIIDLYKIFINNKVINIEQLIFNKCIYDCKKKLNEENIKIYSNLFNWYRKYFKTNEFISCKSYNFEKTPCCYCLKLYINIPLKLKNPDSNYHEKILPPLLFNLVNFKNEFSRLNKINI